MEQMTLSSSSQITSFAPHPVSPAQISFTRSIGTQKQPKTLSRATQTCAVESWKEVYLKDHFMCVLCGNLFVSRESLQNHYKAQHPRKEGKHQCNFCNYSHDRLFNVKLHERTHTGEKPFVCDVCSKEFSRKSRVKRHMKTVHERDKNFECKVCGEKFQSVSYLQRHQRVHTGEGLFVCNLCGVAFTRKNDLHRHLGVHLGVTCKRCGKHFPAPIDYKKHECQTSGSLDGNV